MRERGGGSGWLGPGWAALVDLVLPADCPGCLLVSAGPAGLCPRCAAEVAALVPREARPNPAPPGLPPVVAAAEYAATMRALVLAYKERGRHGLAAPLGDALAEAVAAGLAGAGAAPGSPVVLVGVPSGAAAIRTRHGDHVRRLADRCARRLGDRGWPVTLVSPVRARPRVDSTLLDAAGRVEQALSGFVLTRKWAVGSQSPVDRRATVVLVDDIITTGATVAAVASRLAEAGAPVRFAAVLAATRRRVPPPAVRSAEAVREENSPPNRR